MGQDIKCVCVNCCTHGEVAPAGIEGAEPPKELAVLCHTASEALVHVVVGVDHSRDDDAVVQRDDAPLGAVFIGDALHGPHPLYDVAAHKDGCMIDVSKVLVKGGERLDVGVEHSLGGHWARGAASFNGHDDHVDACAGCGGMDCRAFSHVKHAARRHRQTTPSDAIWHHVLCRNAR